MATAAAIDHTKLEAFMGKMVGDMSAAMSGALVVVGAKSGLYKALARGPATSAELAERSGLFERYVREWLAAQATSGFVDYDADSGRYSMGPEQTAALADSNSRSTSRMRSKSFPRPISTNRKSRLRSSRAGAWVGMSIMNACSGAPSAFSGPAIVPTCFQAGCQRSMASSRNWSAVRAWPISVAAMAPPPS